MIRDFIFFHLERSRLELGKALVLLGSQGPPPPSAALLNSSLPCFCFPHICTAGRQEEQRAGGEPHPAHSCSTKQWLQWKQHSVDRHLEKMPDSLGSHTVSFLVHPLWICNMDISNSQNIPVYYLSPKPHPVHTGGLRLMCWPLSPLGPSVAHIVDTYPTLVENK